MFVSRSFFIRRDLGHLYPFVIAIPRGVISKMPGTDTGKPGSDDPPRGRFPINVHRRAYDAGMRALSEICQVSQNWLNLKRPAA